LQQGGNWQKNQPSLFEWSEAGLEDWTLEQKTAAQQELLGAALEAHPLELVAEKIAASGAITTVDAVSRPGQRVTVAGVRQTSRRSRTAKGEMMMFLSLEDLSGMLDVILFPDVYRAAQALIDLSVPLLITGVIESDASRTEPFLRAEKVAKVE